MSGIFSVAARMKHLLTPATPPAGQSALYFKSDGLPYCLDPTGTERPLIEVAAALHENPTFDQLGGATGIVGWSNFWQDGGATMTSDSVDRIAGSSVKAVVPTGANGRVQEQNAHGVTDVQTITFGFWAKASVNVTCWVEQVTGPTAADAQYFAALGITTQRSIAVTTAWKRYAVVFTVPTGHLFGRFSMVPVAGSPTVTVWWDESFSSAEQSGGLTGVPTGTVLPYALPSAPGGFLNCDGAVYNIADYPTLGGLLLATFGGNGTTTFAVPDLIRRVPVGAGAGIVVGRNEGIPLASASTRTFAHSHTSGNVGHTGTQNTSTGGTGTRVNTIAGSNDGTHSHNIGTAPFDHIPTLCLNYIVKT